MFLLQLKYEALRLMRSPALWWLSVFLAASVGFGLYNGLNRLAAKRASIHEMLSAQQEELLVQKMQADSIHRGLKTENGWWKDPTNAIVVGGMWRGGRVVAIDPAPQSLLAAGVSDLLPDAWRLTLTGKEARGDSVFENPVNLVFGSFDLAFVIAFLLPLMVIALSFNLISGEREQGTLALQRMQPVAQGNLFFHKMLARFAILAALTLLVILPALALSGISLISTAAWTTAGVAVAYSLFWFLLALGINMRGYSSAQNALISIGAWIAFTLIIPAMVNMLAQKVHPIPSRAGFQTAMRDLENQLKESREKRLDAYYQLHPHLIRKAEEDKDWKDWYREEFALLEGEKQLKDSLEFAYAGKGEIQAAFALNLTILSPALSVHRQMADLAGAGRNTYRSLSALFDDAQQRWATLFIDKFNADKRLTTRDYDEMMQFPDKISSSSIPPSLGGGAWLLLQCLLAGFWVLWSYKSER